MEMILLGAGASVEASVPSAFAMTSAILSKFREDPRLRKSAHVLTFVVGGLIFDGSIKNKNPLSPSINIEDLFNAVQLLADRNSLEAASFIGSWHSFVDELDKTVPPTVGGGLQKAIYETITKELQQALGQWPSSNAAAVIDRAIENNIQKRIDALQKGRTASISSSDSVGRAVEKYLSDVVDRWVRRIKRPSSSSSSGRRVDDELARAISSSAARDGEGRVFQVTNQYMIAALKDLVWIDSPADVSYLSPILNLVGKQRVVSIATLNYDNSIELLAGSFGVPCDTGIETWSRTRKLEFGNSGINLLKLHGSIDWGKEMLQESGKMQTTRFRKIDAAEIFAKDFSPAVIFGNRNKLTADGPYLDLLREFDRQLNGADKLTVVGYSFRDPHINIHISNWLNSQPNNKLTIINGEGFRRSIEAEGHEEYSKSLMRFSARNPGRVEILDHFAGNGLKVLFDEYSGQLQSTDHEVRKSAFAEIFEGIDSTDFLDGELLNLVPGETGRED